MHKQQNYLTSKISQYTIVTHLNHEFKNPQTHHLYLESDLPNIATCLIWLGKL